MRLTPGIRSSKSHLGINSPRLAFGHRHATLNRDINSLYDLVTGVAPTLKSYEATNSSHFYHRSAFVGVRDLALVATVCSPMTYEVSEDQSLYFMLPLHGEASAVSEKKTYISSPLLGAAMMPGHARKGVMSEISMLQATLQKERLKRTAMTMMGAEFERTIEDHLLSPKMLAMQANSLRFDHLFSTICRTIDDCALDAERLNSLGFDDLFYRSVVMMNFPEQFAKQSGPSIPSNTVLDLVCDYIDAHLTEPIYLTDLEAVSQLGTRALQYAFQRRFGCTPIRWIRERRLQLAHERLKQAAPHETVTSIALDCGFTSPSDFSRLYAQRYGEPPRSTHKRSMAQ